MHSTLTKVLVRRSAVLLALLLAGCGNIVDPNHSHSGCTIWYNSVWQSAGANLQLDHSDARSCPLNIQAGTYAQTGGKVYDNNAVYPAQGDPISLTIQAFDYSLGSNRDCYTPLGYSSTNWFAYGQTSSGYRRQAEAWPYYYAGDSPDAACFEVNMWSQTTNARAVITINYWGQQA